MTEQVAALGRADARNLIESGGEQGLAAEPAMVGDGEAMGFVPDALQQMRGRRGRDENHGILAAGKEHALLLVTFGFSQAQDVDVEKMQLLERLQGGRELPDAAVDKD